MNLNPTRVLAVIGAALVLMIGGAVAYAQIPSTDGTVTACMVKTSGTIRLIDAEAGATCRSTEKQVTWNQAGSPVSTASLSTRAVVRIAGHGVGPSSAHSRQHCPDGQEGRPVAVARDHLTTFGGFCPLTTTRTCRHPTA